MNGGARSRATWWAMASGTRGIPFRRPFGAVVHFLFVTGGLHHRPNSTSPPGFGGMDRGIA